MVNQMKNKKKSSVEIICVDKKGFTEHQSGISKVHPMDFGRVSSYVINTKKSDFSGRQQFPFLQLFKFHN